MRRVPPPLIRAPLAVAVAPAPAAVTIGISDQQASTFTSPLYAPLNLTTARYITSYDVLTDPYYRAKLDDWLKAARGANQQVLIAFEHSYKIGHQRHAPSIAEYTAAMS